MNKYIFITKEGFTQAPNINFDVNNMQVIGIVNDCENEDEALKKLLKENGWIWESGFNVGDFIVYQIV